MRNVAARLRWPLASIYGSFMECTDILVQEYFKIADIVSSFDDRLLIIKGWSVTFSLFILVAAFQKRMTSLFLIVALSSVCFLMLDVTYKNYQTNYYPQMRNIEIICSSKKSFSNTGIDWGWEQASKGEEVNSKSKPEKRKSLKPLQSFRNNLLHLGVLLPYAFPFLCSLIFGICSFRDPNFFNRIDKTPPHTTTDE